MLFYRVETLGGQGPYRNNLAESMQAYLSADDNFDYDAYYKQCPTPRNDSDAFSKVVYSGSHSGLIFGFNTIKKLKRWFSFGRENEYFEKHNFQVSIYEAKEVFNSRRQSVASKSDLTLVKRIKFSELP